MFILFLFLISLGLFVYYELNFLVSLIKYWVNKCVVYLLVDFLIIDGNFNNVVIKLLLFCLLNEVVYKLFEFILVFLMSEWYLVLVYWIKIVGLLLFWFVVRFILKFNFELSVLFKSKNLVEFLLIILINLFKKKLVFFFLDILNFLLFLINFINCMYKIIKFCLLSLKFLIVYCIFFI